MIDWLRKPWTSLHHTDHQQYHIIISSTTRSIQSLTSVVSQAPLALESHSNNIRVFFSPLCARPVFSISLVVVWFSERMESDWDVIMARQRHSSSSAAPSATKVAASYRGVISEPLSGTTGTRFPHPGYQQRCPWLIYSSPSYGCKDCPDFQARAQSVKLSNLVRHATSQRHIHNAMPSAAAYGCPAKEDFAEVLSQIQTGRSYRHSRLPGAREKKARMMWCLGEALGDDERAFLKKAVWMQSHSLDWLLIDWLIDAWRKEGCFLCGFGIWRGVQARVMALAQDGHDGKLGMTYSASGPQGHRAGILGLLPLQGTASADVTQAIEQARRLKFIWEAVVDRRFRAVDHQHHHYA